MIAQYVLLGDIGGTNFRLAIAQITPSAHTIVFTKTYQTKKVRSIEKTISTFITDSRISVKKGYFGVAGPVKKDRIEMTHAKLVFDKKTLLAKTSLESIELFNDFRAEAFGAQHTKHTKVLQKGTPCSRKLVIGAGTGLGVAYIEDGKVKRSEDGHLLFTPETEQDKKLVKFLEKKLKRKVQWEDLVNGKGLELLYLFKTGKKLKAPDIGQKKTKLAQRVFDVYFEYLGRCIHMLTLKHHLCQVYISGGIVQKNLFRIQKRSFLKTIKGSSRRLKDMQVELIVDEHITFHGLSFYAQTQQESFPSCRPCLH